MIEQASAGVGGTVYLEGVDGSWRETMLVELQGGSGQQSRVRGKRTTDRDLGLPHAPGRGGLCLPRCGHWPCRGPGRRELVSRASRESSRMGRSRCSKRGLTLLPPEPRAAVIASLGVDRSRDRGAGACRRLAAECSPTSSKFFAALGWSGGAGWCRTGMTGPTFLIQRQLLVDQPAGSRVCSGRWLAPGLSTNRRPLLQANVGGPSIHSIPSSSLSLASPRLASCQNPTPQHPRAAARELAPALPTRAHRAAFALLPLVVSFVPTTGLDLRPHSHSPSGVPPSFAVCQPADPGPRRRETLDMASRAAQKRVGHHHGRGTWQPRSTRN